LYAVMQASTNPFLVGLICARVVGLRLEERSRVASACLGDSRLSMHFLMSAAKDWGVGGVGVNGTDWAGFWPATTKVTGISVAKMGCE